MAIINVIFTFVIVIFVFLFVLSCTLDVLHLQTKLLACLPAQTRALPDLFLSTDQVSIALNLSAKARDVKALNP